MVQQASVVFALLMCFAYGNAVAAPPNDIATKTATLKKVAQCTTGRKLNVLVEDVIITPGGKNLQSVSAKFNVKEDIKNQFHLQIDVRKCDVNGNPDHCEYVMKSYNMTDLCTIIGQDDEAWTFLFNNMDIKRECPIDTGVYTLQKTTITKEMLAFMPLGNAIWKVQLTGFNGNLNILCVEVEIVVKMVNVRSGGRGRRQ